MDTLPKLYTELADWWPVLSAPEDYAQEAAFYRRILDDAGDGPLRTLLELGSGGGNNASHLKQHVEMTLVDRSPAMLAVSRTLNPACEHVVGDMRTVRLDRVFDAVFIHDAIDYMQTEDDLRQAIGTAYAHCRPGGVALFAPDHTVESFRPGTSHGGHDRGDRSLRYLEWTWDFDPGDTTYETVMVYVLREADGSVRCVQDRHRFGLFSERRWLQVLEEAGFRVRVISGDQQEDEIAPCGVFLGVKP